MRFSEKFIFPSLWVSERSQTILRKWPERPRVTEKDNGAPPSCQSGPPAHYGHPSKVGFKDLCPLWKATEFDPDHLMELYKRAGTKYFVSMGVPHDNLDLWNSKYTRWNAVKVGPHKDVVGLSETDDCVRACEGAREVDNLAADMGGMGFIERFRVECLRSILIEKLANTRQIEQAFPNG